MRLLQYGIGAMGSLMVQLATKKNNIEIVGAIDHDPDKHGHDIGHISGLDHDFGVLVGDASTLDDIKADIALHATTAFAEDAFPIIKALIARRMNVVTITQELFFPLGPNLAIAKEIDRLAKAAGVSVTATGVNPGFILDVLPVAASTACWQVDHVQGSRIVDFSPYGPDEMVHIGAGLSEDAFIAGAQRGEIGHIGLLETAAMVVHALGLEVDELVQTKSPIITDQPRATGFVTIEAGHVSGFRQTVTGRSGSREKIAFEMIGLLAPQDGDPEMGDRFRIEGTPCVDVTTREEVSQRGGLGTAAAAVNAIPRLMAAQPGFHTALDLGMPGIWPRNAMRRDAIRTRTRVEGAARFR